MKGLRIDLFVNFVTSFKLKVYFKFNFKKKYLKAVKIIYNHGQLIWTKVSLINKAINLISDDFLLKQNLNLRKEL